MVDKNACIYHLKCSHAPAQRQAQPSLTRIGEIPIYAVDSLVRRSQPLQKTQAIMEGELAAVRIHPETAQTLSFAR